VVNCFASSSPRCGEPLSDLEDFHPCVLEFQEATGFCTRYPPVGVFAAQISLHRQPRSACQCNLPAGYKVAECVTPSLQPSHLLIMIITTALGMMIHGTAVAGLEHLPLSLSPSLPPSPTSHSQNALLS
jgi:hypothetical protein